MPIYHIMNIRKNFHWLSTRTVEDARKTIQLSETPYEYAIYTNTILAENIIKAGKYKDPVYIEQDLESFHKSIDYLFNSEI